MNTCTRCPAEPLIYYVVHLDNGNLQMVLAHDTADARVVGERMNTGRTVVGVFEKVSE